MSLILWLVVGSVEIVAATCQTGIHDSEILVRQGEVDNQLRLEVVEQRLKLLNVVGVHLCCLDVHRVPGLVYGINNLVALFLAATCYHEFCKHIGILCNLECRYGGNATCTNHKYSSHCLYLFLLLSYFIKYYSHPSSSSE